MKIKPKKITLFQKNFLIILLFNTVFFYYSCSSEVISESLENTTIYASQTIKSGLKKLDLSNQVPIGPNSWIAGDITKDPIIISKDGIHNWESTNDVINTYIKTGAGKLKVGLQVKSPTGSSKIKVTISGVSETVDVNSTEFEVVDIGTFDVTGGYVKIEIEGVEKNGAEIAEISNVLLGGTAIATTLNFVPKSNNLYGRRGPSVHMGYELPSGKDTKWFYNEVTVPKGQDKFGSFFMTNGHAEGYFGLQVNSKTERRILFSIWSAYVTDDPNQIPKDYTVTSLGSGSGVTVKNFGGEGSGIQSFKNVGWKAGITYKFLLKGEPSSVAGSTDYTGYFFDPEVGEWQLIASLRRPKTTTYLTGVYSFLENFEPSAGDQLRKVNYGNQWAYTTENNWVEVTKGNFTVDGTGKNGDRLDYAGGVKGNKFFLKDCGFFDTNVANNTSFTRTANGTAPNIDFSKLPVPKVPVVKKIKLIDNSSWSLSSYSTQEDNGGEGTTGRATDIIDNDLSTYWHSCWTGTCTATIPHKIVVDMGAITKVEGLQFFQRQTNTTTVKKVEIKVSADKSSWSSAGSFELMQTKDGQRLDFSSAKNFRYFKIIIRESHDGSTDAALAEVKAYTFKE